MRMAYHWLKKKAISEDSSLFGDENKLVEYLLHHEY